MFEAQLIYIPSVLAAMLGAVPFLGAYWATLPAIIEIWLLNGKGWRAVTLLILAILPTQFVDSAIYSEIKGYASRNVARE